jgi:hypothetical protein
MNPLPLSQKIGAAVALAIFLGALILYATGNHL